MVGDFNAVRKKDDRIGRNISSSVVLTTEMVEFNSFIDNIRLQDIPLIS